MIEWQDRQYCFLIPVQTVTKAGSESLHDSRRQTQPVSGTEGKLVFFAPTPEDIQASSFGFKI